LFEGVGWFWGLTCDLWAENAKNKCEGNGMGVSDDDGNATPSEEDRATSDLFGDEKDGLLRQGYEGKSCG
jgi:hypothetical protein